MRAPRAWALGAALVLATASAAPQEGAPPAESGPAMARNAERFGLVLSKGAPLTISSEELDLTRQEDGGERVVFRKQVDVVQGDLRIRCDWLEALYPQGTAGPPSRITARGHVRIEQAETEVRCGEAVFENSVCKAVCTGIEQPAALRRGDNVIRGERILFDLCSGQLTVRGAARVQVREGGEGS